ncbi:uncharacterized protein YeaO (DUF488 family) [Nitrobacter vulgaris]|nr:uncharacterized protein YeaO (DUF488 family) [Nitrobacter vulgaris]
MGYSNVQIPGKPVTLQPKLGEEDCTIHVQVKRIYENPSLDDGIRILVDRLWPRGLTKKAAAVDRWAKEIAPSTPLRKWFAHDPERWIEFRRRYTAELQEKSEMLGEIRRLARENPITLVYAARDEVHNGATVLREVLIGK